MLVIEHCRLEFREELKGVERERGLNESELRENKMCGWKQVALPGFELVSRSERVARVVIGVLWFLMFAPITCYLLLLGARIVRCGIHC